MSLLLLLACDPFSKAFFEDSVSGFATDSFIDCEVTGEVQAWAASDAAVGPRRLVEGGPLPLVHDGDARALELVVGVGAPSDFARVVATLADETGTVVAETDVPQGALPFPGRPCWSRYEDVRLVLDPGVPVAGAAFLLDLGVEGEVGTDTRSDSWLLVGRD